MHSQNRRRFLAVAAAAGLAGCTGTGGGAADATEGEAPTTTETSDETDAPDDDTEETDSPTPEANAEPPVASATLPVPDDRSALVEAATNGGPPKDGIPSVDEPEFESAEAAADRLDPDHPVFGVVIDGEAKAYPQEVLVWHEITNDVVGGVPVAVSYCPLTGTAMAFERGETTFGVSGDLVNSNLIMYDRGTDSRWPQVLGTAIEGPMAGESLRERPVVWSTIEAWTEAHPDSRVLTEDTGYIRDYGSDPYGSYNPRGGYYSDDRLQFDVRHEDDRFDRKSVVVGARTHDVDPVAVEKDRLRSSGSVSGAGVTFVHDDATDAAYAYRADDGPAVESVDGPKASLSDGSTSPVADLPKARVTGFDAMWFAWYAFYPNTAVLE